MPKREAPVMETQRLILRPRKEKDIPRMLKAFQTEEVREFLGGHPPDSLHAMKNIVNRRNVRQWTVALQETDEYIGECDIHGIVDDYLGEIGYMFLREYWGNGYAFEAVARMIEHAFGPLQLRRIYAKIDARNLRSVNLIERLEFKRVAMLPEADFGGRVADIFYYSKKRSD